MCSFSNSISWREWADAFDAECVGRLAQFEQNGTKLAPARRSSTYLTYDYYDFLANRVEHISSDRTFITFLVAKLWRNDPYLHTMIRGVRDPKILTAKTGLVGLSLLSLAIILQSTRTVEIILNKIDKERGINSQDQAGWTALHHASVSSSKEIRKQIKAKGANRGIKNVFNATPSILKRIVSLTKQDDFPFLYGESAKQDDRELLASEFMQSSHAAIFSTPAKVMCRTCKISPNIIYETWSAHIQDSFYTKHDNLSFHVPVYLKGLTSLYSRGILPVNRKISLRPVVVNDKEVPIKNQVGSGVFAVRQIEQDEEIDFYGGLIEDSKGLRKERHYNLAIYETFGIKDDRYINATESRSLGACVNHSFPNATFCEDAEGNSIIKAIMPIKRDEEICVSYGPFYFQPTDTTIELRPKALEKFAKSHPLNEAASILQTRKPLYEYICWSYMLIDTPVSFLRLILKNIICKADVDYFTSQINSKKILEKFPEIFPQDVLGFCFRLVKSDKEKASQLADYLHMKCYLTVESLQKALREVKQIEITSLTEQLDNNLRLNK